MTKISLTNDERAAVLFEASRASRVVAGSCVLRGADGGMLVNEAVDELLAKAVRRERVSAQLDLMAFEQGELDSDGQVLRNRNYVRFRDGAMMSLGRSGRGTPFLRDHRQRDSLSVEGTIIESQTHKVAETGHYKLQQTALLTEPVAVEAALRGLMSAVSIGWNPTGPVMCTVCKAEILTVCWHWPGDMVAGTQAGAPTQVVEWEYTSAELLETSRVPIGGVATAGVDRVRATLSATYPEALLLPGGASQAIDGGRRAVMLAADRSSQEKQVMGPKILAALKLKEGATEEDAVAAIAALAKAQEDATDSAAVAAERLQANESRLATLEAADKARAKAARKAKIDALLASGAIAPRSKTFETLTKRSEREDVEGFDALVADLEGVQVTPAGAQLQANQPEGAADGDPLAAACAANPNLAPMLRKAGITKEQFAKHGAKALR